MLFFLFFLFFRRRLESRNLLDCRDDLFWRDKARAFELAVIALVPRTPQKVEMVEILAHVVPAGMACVVVDDAVWCVELVGGVSEA